MKWLTFEVITLAQINIDKYSWIGSSKWIIRALKQYDEKLTEEFVESFDDFYKTGEKRKVIHLSEMVLEPYGGRLFEGFSLGKETP